VGRWFAEITNKRIRRGVFRSVKELEPPPENTSKRVTTPQVLRLAEKADQILASIARSAQRTAPFSRRDLYHEPLGQKTVLRNICPRATTKLTIKVLPKACIRGRNRSGHNRFPDQGKVESSTAAC
jgi:hypothetical protein